MNRRLTFLLVGLTCVLGPALAQDRHPAHSYPEIELQRPAFDALTDAELEALYGRYQVKVREASEFGIVHDAQTVNESTGASVAGSAIGAAAGEIGYLNSARSSGEYSGTKHVGFAILGAMLGSIGNRDAETWFRTQYTVKLEDGSLVERIQSKTSPFAIAPGTCMDLFHVAKAPQEMCWQTPDSVRAKYLALQQASPPKQ